MVCQKANPRIVVKRAIFSTFNHIDVRNALNSLGPLDMKKVCNMYIVCFPMRRATCDAP
jgi:hypothetical protein